MLTPTAVSDLRTLLSIPMPFRVNAKGGFCVPPRLSIGFDVTICDIKTLSCWFSADFDIAICDFKSPSSLFVNWNMKSSGNRPILRLPD